MRLGGLSAELDRGGELVPDAVSEVLDIEVTG
jgi:hypothetical protein